MSGITAAGFVRKTYEEILTDLEAAARLSFGSDVDLSEFSPTGKFIMLMANSLSENWQLFEDLYYSTFIDTSEGTTLDRVCALGGISRRPATQSAVTLTLSGVNTTVVSTGFIAQTATGIQFITTEEGTISGGTVDIPARAVVAGAEGNVADSTITEIVTPVTGVTSVTNAAEATGGSAIETDAELRERYKFRGVTGGSSAVAIQTVLLDIESIISAVCYENNTDGIVDGMTPHSIECVIDGGSNAEIMDVLLNYKPAGIETIGAVTDSVVDNAGVTRTFNWNVPTPIDIWVDVDITKNALWQASYEAQVKAKVAEIVGGTSGAVTYAGRGIGEDVKSWRIIANFDDIVGIDSVIVKVEDGAAPTLDIFPIDRDERARTDDAKITVTAT